MKHTKLWAVMLLIATIVCSLFPVFTPVQVAAATYTLVKSGANPLVSSGISASNETVIFDSSAGLYKMWYVQTTNTDNTITSYLYSLLSPYPTLISDLQAGNYSTIAASASELHEIKLALTSLAGLNSTQIGNYVASINTSLEYATSTDGITWSAPTPATFTTTTAWDQFISSVNVIKDGSTFKMWYTGFQVNASDLHQIFVDLNTVMSDIPAVDTATFFGDIVSGNITDLQSKITSLSLKTPLESVLTDVLTFASDSAPQIGYAESSNGTSWTKYLSDPVMGTDGVTDWDNLGVMTPSVIKNGTTYEMWYTGIQLSAGLATGLFSATTQSGLETALLNGVNVAICYATSPDGKTWTKNASPVLTRTSLGWDSYGVCAPSVVMNADGTYAMWYTGVTSSVSSFFTYLNHTITLDSLFLTGSNMAIGHATSTNGTTWTQDGSNPVLSKGSSGTWDNGGVAFPSVIATASKINLWYTGISASPSAALTSFLNGGNLSSILAAGTGTGEKIGFASLDATLSSLTISAGAFSPAFASGTTSYVDNLDNLTNSVTVTPTVNQASATITVNGNPVTSGSASGIIYLNVGDNIITIVVTAQDGVTHNSYYITVTRAAAPTTTTTTTTTPTTTTTTTPTTTTTTTPTTTTTTTTTPTTTATTTITPTTTTTTTTPTPTTTTTPGQADLSLVVNDQGVFTQGVSIPSTDDQISLSIPSGTVGLNADETPLSQISILPTNPPAPPSGSNVIGLAYDFEPSGATFSPPISMTFNIPSGVDETNLTVAFYNTTTGQWITVPATVDPVTNTITAQISHFTTYAVMSSTASTTPASTTHKALIWTIIIIVIVLLVIAGVVIWLVRRKKK